MRRSVEAITAERETIVALYDGDRSVRSEDSDVNRRPMKRRLGATKCAYYKLD